MDWREMAGRPTTRALPGEGPWQSFNSVWSGGKQVGMGSIQQGALRSVDPIRSWIIAVCWMAASAAEYVSLHRVPHTLSSPRGLALQRILCICAHPKTKAHPRFRLHSRIQSPRSHYVLRRRHSNIPLLLAGHGRQHHGHRHLRRTVMCQARDERGPRGRFSERRGGQCGDGQSPSGRLAYGFAFGLLKVRLRSACLLP